MTTNKKDTPLIAIVGPCSSGKSTLIAGLKKYGLRTRHLAQEHSYVKDMWRRFTNPDILIYLHVSYPIAQERRKQSWTEKEYKKQVERLSHARAHTDFYLDTDNKTPAQILAETVNFLKDAGVL